MEFPIINCQQLVSISEAMDFLQLPATPMAAILSFLLFLFSLMLILQRKAYQKRLPPQAAGALPVVGHLPLLRGQQLPHIMLSNMADKYGPIFTIKMGMFRTMIISSWELAKECFTTNDRIFATRPNFIVGEVMGYNNAMFGFSPYGPYWREVRKIATTELLSNHRLQMFKHVRESEIQEAMKRIHEHWSKKRSTSGKALINMTQWLGDVTLNVIFRIVLGKRYAEYETLQEGGEVTDKRRAAMRKFLVFNQFFAVYDGVPFLRWLDIKGYLKAMKKAARELDVVVQEWLDEHKQKRLSSKVNGEEDFMDVMLSVLYDSYDVPSHETDSIIKATCLSLVLAGSDGTTATTVEALSFLLKNSDALKKAQLELDTKIGRDRHVLESDMNNLVYLQAVLKETLRLTTSVSVPHESMEDCAVGGYHIPKGTQLFVNFWKLHRDPRVWTDPEEFRPERFLTTHKDIDSRGQNFEFIPFGSGRRMCPGAAYALQVIQLSLASLLHRFNISTPSDNPDQDFGGTTRAANQLEVILSPRLPAYLY